MMCFEVFTLGKSLVAREADGWMDLPPRSPKWSGTVEWSEDRESRLSTRVRLSVTQ